MTPNTSKLTLKSNLLILGIDPGSRITGYGLLEWQAGKIHYHASGCIRLKSTEFAQRLAYLQQSIEQLVETYQPDLVSIEKLFVAKNIDSAIKLSHARGVILSQLALAKLPIAEYAPTKIKQSVTGQGRASKQLIQEMLVHQLQLSGKPQADAADALACAFCHLSQIKYTRSTQQTSNT